MAHVIKYQKLIEGNEVTDAAAEKFRSFVEAGKLIDFDTVVTLAGTFCYMRFTDEATADEYLAEMGAISEEAATGHYRGPLVRYDE